MEQSALPKGPRFGILHRTIRRALDERLREIGLTGAQFGVLAALGQLEREGAAVTQRVLEEAAHTTHPTMTELLKKLERKGFVTCRTSEADRRCKVIAATDTARALHHTVDELDGRIFDELCRGLSEKEVAEFLRITDVMLENAKNMEDAREELPCGKGCESP